MTGKCLSETQTITSKRLSGLTMMMIYDKLRITFLKQSPITLMTNWPVSMTKPSSIKLCLSYRRTRLFFLERWIQ